jgi:hypothetical protein
MLANPTLKTEARGVLLVLIAVAVLTLLFVICAAGSLLLTHTFSSYPVLYFPAERDKSTRTNVKDI